IGFCGGRPFEIRSAHLEHMTQVQSALQKQHFDTCPRALSQGKTSAGCSFVYLLTIPQDKTTISAYGSYVSLSCTQWTEVTVFRRHDCGSNFPPSLIIGYGISSEIEVQSGGGKGNGGRSIGSRVEVV